MRFALSRVVLPIGRVAYDAGSLPGSYDGIREPSRVGSVEPENTGDKPTQGTWQVRDARRSPGMSYTSSANPSARVEQDAVRHGDLGV